MSRKLATATRTTRRRSERPVGRARRAVASVLTGVMLGNVLVPAPAPYQSGDRPPLDRAGLVAACTSAQQIIGSPVVLAPRNALSSSPAGRLAPLPRGAVVRVTDSAVDFSFGTQTLTVNGRPWGVVATSFHYPYHDTAWVEMGGPTDRFGGVDWSKIPALPSATPTRLFDSSPGVVGAIDVRTPTRNPYWARILNGADGAQWIACLPQRAGDPTAPIRLFRDGRLEAVAHPTVDAAGTSTYRLRVPYSGKALLDMTVAPKVERPPDPDGSLEYYEELRKHAYDQSNVTFRLRSSTDPTLPLLLTQLLSSPHPSAIVDEAAASAAAQKIQNAITRKDLAATRALLDVQPSSQRLLTGQIFYELYGKQLPDRVRSLFAEVYPHPTDKDRALLESTLLGGKNMVEATHRRAAEESSTAAKIIEDAERFHIQYAVVPDEIYDAQWPGSVGVVDEGRVYIKNKVVFDGGITVIHEDLHVMLASALATSLPQTERVRRTREAFVRMKLDPFIGEQIAEATAGWPDHAEVAAQHVAIAILVTQVRREEDGVTPFTSPSKPETIEQVALRSLSDHLLNRRKELSRADYPDSQLLAEWRHAGFSREAASISGIRKLLERLDSDRSLPVG